MNQSKVQIQARSTAAARYHAKVMCCKTGKIIKDYGEHPNLLTVNPHNPYALGKQIQKCYAGTGTTPNKRLLDGTFQQTGTTVTRATGSGVFAGSNVNDFIKFSGGKRARIISFTNTLTVEVDREQTVAASTATIYDTSRTALDAEVKNTTTESGVSGESGSSNDTETGTLTLWNTFNFTTETSAQTYQEIGFSSNEVSVLFGRLVLDTPISVDVDQFLQVKVTLIWTLTNFRTATPINVEVTGWPRPYAIQSIQATGTYFDVELDEAHHYLAAGKINIEAAVPTRVGITSISSDASTFTVITSEAHGFSAGDDIEIENSSQAGYNGSWLVDSVTNSTTLVISSSINLGAATGGTIRHETPGTWFDGEWTIASVPTTTSVRITSAINAPDAGAYGSAYNNLKASAIISGVGLTTSVTAQTNGGIAEPFGNRIKTIYFIETAQVRTGMAYGVTTSLPATVGSRNASGTVFTPYDNAELTRTDTFVVGTSVSISTKIKQIAIGADGGFLWITFEEPQRKDNGYILTIEFKTYWEPSLD